MEFIEIKTKTLQDQFHKAKTDPEKKELSIYPVCEYKEKYVYFSPFESKLILVDLETDENIKNKTFENLPGSFFLKPPLKKKLVPPKQSISSLCINSTEACNLNCVYCSTDSSTFCDKIDVNFVKRYIDHMLKTRDISTMHIYFFGKGEPTLTFNEMKEITEYAKNKVDIQTYTQTNGVISDKVREWLLKNVGFVGVSCDGPPEIHDLQRKDHTGAKTGKKVEETIKFFIKNKKPIKVKAVISDSVVHRIPEIVEYFNQLGVEDFEINPVNNVGKADRDEIRTSPEAFAKGFTKAYELCELYEIKLTGFSFRITEGSISYYSCNPYLDTLTPDHKIYWCDYLTNGFFKVGEYDKEKKKFNLNYAQRKEIFKRNVEDIEMCKNCYYKWHCGGGCPAIALEKNKTIYEPYEPECKSKKTIAQEHFLYLIEKKLSLKPYLEKKGSNLFYTMISNQFKLITAGVKDDFKENPLITINGDFSEQYLLDKILKYRESRNYKPTLFLIRAEYMKLPAKTQKKLINLRKNLKKARVLFRFTRPFPKCINKGEELDCEKCIDFIRVEDSGKIRYCGGSISKYSIDEAKSRSVLLNEFRSIQEKNNEHNPKCRFCSLRLKKECTLFCNHF